MGTAPAKTCSQLGDANLRKATFLLLTRLPKMPFLSAGYSTPSLRPAPVTCLHPSSGLFVLASASELAALAKVPTQLVVNQDTRKALLGCSAQISKTTAYEHLGHRGGQILEQKDKQPRVHYLKSTWLPVEKVTGCFPSTSDNSKSYIVFNINNTCFIP